VRWLPAGTPRLDTVTIDGRVLGFTAAASILAATLAALGPILRVPVGASGSAALRDGGRSASHGRGRNRLSGALVITEVAVAVSLVVGAGLVLRSLAAMLAVDSGLDVRRLVSARVTVDPPECVELDATAVAPCRAFYQRLEERLGAMPGVRRYALANQLPLEDGGSQMPVDIEDHPRPPSEPAHLLFRHVVTPEYFDMLGFTKEEGRLLTPADRRGAPAVAVASRSLADRYWPGQSAVGKRFRPVWWGPDQWITIVGVVADVRHRGAWDQPSLVYYSPVSQAPQAATYALVETSLTLPAFESGFRDLVRSVDPRVPVSRVQTMPDVAAASVAAPRVTAVLLGGFALLALVLGAVGVYGVLSYGVSQRRREIGIRMAIGAEPGALRLMVLRRAGALVAGGLGLGMAAAWLGASAMRGFVYGVSTRDPLTYAAAAGLFGVVGLAAAYLPARRATRVEVLGVLKEE
jgi:predicted permease